MVKVIAVLTRAKLVYLYEIDKGCDLFWWWPGFEPGGLHILCIVYIN